MLTIQNQTHAGKNFKCTIFVGYGGVRRSDIFLLVSHRMGKTVTKVFNRGKLAAKDYID